MGRRILFIAFYFAVHRRADASERYSDTRTILERYGKVIRERTSGVHRRITPPDGVSLLSPDQHEIERRETERRKRHLLEALPESHCVVARADCMDPIMIEVIDAAIRLRKPVLILREHVLLIDEQLDRYKNREREHVAYREFRTLEEHVKAVARFMQCVPNGDVVGGIT